MEGKCGGHTCECGGPSCGQERGPGDCGPCEEEDSCSCQCHEPEMCEDCARSGHKVKFLVMKAMKKMLVGRIKDKLEKKYGKKMDAVADMAFEAFEKHMKLKKEMMEQEEFDLREKMMEIFKD
jgi:hypothetical protein